MKLLFTTDDKQALNTTKITTHPARQVEWQTIERALKIEKKLTVINAKNNSQIQLNVTDIIAIETEGAMCNVQTLDGAMYLLNKRLKTIKEEFQQQRFMQINNQVMVNLDHIQQFVSATNARIELQLTNDLHYFVSRHYLKQFRRNFL